MRDQKSERTIIKADSGFFVATYIEGRKRQNGNMAAFLCASACYRLGNRAHG